ncbi:MAG: hypothetical protein Q8942_04955 [Bacillota bacterium]|nr:hypothetical protein [Bacillota bacterium]
MKGTDIGGECCGSNFPALLANWVGTTVTIFTSSGGQSGAGFTGVLLCVNDVFVRLISRIGPPPGCALGNACTGFAVGDCGYGSNNGCGGGFGAGYGSGPTFPASLNGAEGAGGWNGFPVYTVGSVVDIPTDRIVSFVHNAV